MTTSRIKCRVDSGMFSDEYVVTVSSGDSEASFFVPRDAVEMTGTEDGAVRVDIFEKEGVRWGVLPDAERSVIPVSEGDLLAA